jgi:hypothetical protein
MSPYPRSEIQAAVTVIPKIRAALAKTRRTNADMLGTPSCKLPSAECQAQHGPRPPSSAAPLTALGCWNEVSMGRSRIAADQAQLEAPSAAWRPVCMACGNGWRVIGSRSSDLTPSGRSIRPAGRVTLPSGPVTFPSRPVSISSRTGYPRISSPLRRYSVPIGTDLVPIRSRRGPNVYPQAQYRDGRDGIGGRRVSSATHPELAGDLQLVPVEKANPHRHGDGSGRFSTAEDSTVGRGTKDPKSPHYSPYHLIRDPELNPRAYEVVQPRQSFVPWFISGVRPGRRRHPPLNSSATGCTR